MSFYDREKEESKEQEIIRLWRPATNHYTGEPCPNCGRNRLMLCNNGKTRCEKCNWIVDDKEYCTVSDYI